MNDTAQELRAGFLRYFQDQGHAVVPSAPLIPQADPTLLFTNAGMNQFKRVFLGEETRPFRRAVSVQKCLRAGGKHNDLENVGYTRRHHTFFEMLGNFSFGDYFKEDAIHFGWEFLTRTVGLPKDRIWVTVFRDDDDAADLWQRTIGLPESRVVRLGEQDNFWQMGDTGPCGPCSEILIDQGAEVGCGRAECAVGCECDRYLEIWNLVFMQYDRDATGTLTPLPNPSIDTGMGLERLAAVAQGVHSNYDSDIFQPLLQAVAQRTKKTYGHDASADRSIRVVADHLRAMTFLVGDGVLPSNEGRGYVLRRILRRAARHGRLLGVHEPFLSALTRSVIGQMQETYTDLPHAAESIALVTEAEEDRFIATLDQGLPILTDMVSAAKQAGRTFLPGEDVFKLYDTYGFPLDLIAEACREQSMDHDETGFQRALDEQRHRARTHATFEVAAPTPVLSDLAGRLARTEFVGYARLESEGIIQAILQGEHLVKEAVAGEEVEVALDVTPFYAAGGGQVGDRGVLVGPGGRVEVTETTKPVGHLFLHKGIVQAGRIVEGERLTAQVDGETRRHAARNHTATHLVHAALRDLLGPHVKQYGSLVAPNRLRFDFAHFTPLSSRALDDIEGMVNDRVRRNDFVQTDVMDLQEAVSSGALAFFGDKYGEQVRVVSIDSFSRELCGGTHCRQTGEIGLFKIVSETGVAAGVRRIEAQTGLGAYDLLKSHEGQIDDLAAILKANRGDVVVKAKKLVAQLKERDQELHALKAKLAVGHGTGAGGQTRTIAGVTVYVQRIDGLDIKDLRTAMDSLKQNMKSGVLVLGSAKDGKASLLVVSTPDVARRLPAGDLIKPLAAEVGGTGGGRPEMAQAGGNRPEGLDHALEKVFWLVEQRGQE